MSHSNPRTTTNTSTPTTNTSKNLNLQDTSGITVGEAGGDITIVNTDHNAFDRASELAMESLAVSQSLGEDAFATSEYFAKLFAEGSAYSLDAVTGFGDSAFSAVDQLFADSAAYQNKALTAVQDTQADALSTVSDLFRDAFTGVTDFVKDLQGNAQTQLGETVTALNAIAVENNKSSDQRIAEISEGTTRSVIWIVAIIVVGGVAYAAFKE